MRDKKWLKSWRWYATPHSLPNRRDVPMFYTFHENPQKQKQQQPKSELLLCLKKRGDFGKIECNRSGSRWHEFTKKKNYPWIPNLHELWALKYMICSWLFRKEQHTKKATIFYLWLACCLQIVEAETVIATGVVFFCFFFFSHTLFWRVFSILLNKIYRIFLRIFPPHLIVCISVFDICDLFTWEFFEMVWNGITTRPDSTIC